ncbi:MAG: hypothetical protein ABSF95_07125 [Verrucomicrobiota bacterium]|jgi:hypothetical protein
MHPCQTCQASSCPATLSRRRFLTGAAAAAATVAGRMGLFDFASSLSATEPNPPGQPVINVVFIRPEQAPIVSWPGGNCDVPAQQALFTRTLADAAKLLDVRLEVRHKPLSQAGEVGEYLQQLKQAPPDGLLVCAMELVLWEPVNQIIQHRGDLPLLVYSNVTGFTQQLQTGRDAPRVYVGATQEVGWLATGLRLLSAIPRLKQTRVLFVAGNDTRDQVIEGLGTTFHWIPKARFAQAFKQVGPTKEVRAIADFYIRNARKIVEPKAPDVLEAAKNYVVCRRLMELENCQGIAIDCLGWQNPVCLAFSKLRDQGIVAVCEQDTNATIGMLLTHLLAGRPCFQQDPSPNTVNNTLIGAHCTSPLRLEGFDQPYRAPYLLRDYHTRTGVSPQVLWPPGQPVTILQANLKPLSVMLGTGRVVANVAQPPSGCCRTAVEIELDGVADTRDVKGFHQHFVLGNLARPFKAYGRLAGIPVTPIC